MAQPTQAPFRLCLIIDVDSEPITGSIAGLGHAPLQFYGWLELLVALDAINHGEMAKLVGASLIWTSDDEW